MSIYILTMVAGLRDSRPIGISTIQFELDDKLIRNSRDFRECKYDFAVIEEYKPGIYPDVIGEQWYVFTDRQKYEKIGKPDWAVTVTNWGIG